MKIKLLLSVGEGKQVKTELKEMSVEDLSFYPENPRISSLLLHYTGKLDNNSIQKLMWEKQSEATRDLYQQIKKLLLSSLRRECRCRFLMLSN